MGQIGIIIDIVEAQALTKKFVSLTFKMHNLQTDS